MLDFTKRDKEAAQPSESQTSRVAAIGKRLRHPGRALRLRSGQAPRGPGSKLICGCVGATTLGPGLRRDNEVRSSSVQLRGRLRQRSSDRVRTKIAYCNV